MLVGCRRRGGRLRIEVYDTGIGIPHAKRRAVFKEFHRLDQGARVARGVGLGLSIVERIARVLDCEVTLKSNVGRGSRFSIEVPRGERLAAAPKLRALPRLDVGGSTARSCSASTTSAPSSTAWRRCLGGWGCRTLKAARSHRGARGDRCAAVSNPTDFWSTITSTAPTALRQSRELRRRLGRHVPAIVITADRSLHVREEARAEGAHLLNKPIKPASLRALITQWRVQRVAAE